jgi:acetoin utilization deacetylase AcuC-like enzyme
MWHDTGHGAAFVPCDGHVVEPEAHVESAPPKRRFRNLVDASGLLDHLVVIPPRMPTPAEVLRLHTAEYVALIEDLSAGRNRNAGEALESTTVGRGSYEIALLAVGGCLAALEAVVTGKVDNAYALVRPPGHHAEPARGRGGCIFSNLVLAALHARDGLGLERIAIVDWDVHHGNGAELAFSDERSVLTISLHQENVYPPRSGGVAERGSGAGEGYNLNVPLPPGSGEGAYLAAIDRVVVPALEAYRPDVVLVGCGLDASAMDPLGRMLLHSGSFAAMTRRVLDTADAVCGGRVVFCQEGGYSSAYVPFCGVAIVEELAGVSARVEDPFLETWANIAGQELQPHQDAAIVAAERNVAALTG